MTAKWHFFSQTSVCEHGTPICWFHQGSTLPDQLVGDVQHLLANVHQTGIFGGLYDPDQMRYLDQRWLFPYKELPFGNSLHHWWDRRSDTNWQHIMTLSGPTEKDVIEVVDKPLRFLYSAAETIGGVIGLSESRRIVRGTWEADLPVKWVNVK